MTIHYSDYLQLEKILGAQFPESDKTAEPAHDEMLFIIIHQAYELWFKQLIFEIDSVLGIMKKPAINDNSPEMQTVVHRCSRVVSILKLLVHQIDIMETMTPMDFLDFRDLLRPASGFQSWQFKLLEAKLGLAFEQRHGQNYYISQLRETEVAAIREGESEVSLLQLVNNWLERMPFFREASNWEHYSRQVNTEVAVEDIFWTDYRQIYANGLASVESVNLAHFDKVFGLEAGDESRAISPAASRSALFIMLYRGYPMLQTPFQLLNNLLEIDEQLSTWRYRHMSMVHRTIGTRIGTGGSTGRDYLKGALDKHYIFAELTRMTSFLIERKKLPLLSHEMEKRLGFLV
ncbi:tryptophan 2,3-dioxygenase [Flavitalea sp.]|nr:tryptophan 2,3-dioxygenase family protein [Flavitalea sp.]